MKEYRYLDNPQVITYIKSLDLEDLEDQENVIGMLYINYFDDAGMELINLSKQKYLDYIFTYILGNNFESRFNY